MMNKGDVGFIKKETWEISYHKIIVKVILCKRNIKIENLYTSGKKWTKVVINFLTLTLYQWKIFKKKESKLYTSKV